MTITGMQLPAGVSPEMLRAIQAWAAKEDEAKRSAQAPSGLIPQHLIRGVNPNYKYEYREYPKMIPCPPVAIRSKAEEITRRREWGMPLPWDANDPEARPYIEAYFAERSYPLEMVRPGITVHSRDEEDAYMAKWKAEGAKMPAVYPRWKFHPTQQPAYVASAEQEKLLGQGWFDTIEEAHGALTGKKVDAPIRPSTRDEMEARAAELGIQIDRRWGEARIKAAIDEAEAAAQEAEATA